MMRFGGGNAGGHQERGPDHACCADDFLADDVVIDRPVLLHWLSSRAEAERRQVVGQRIEPDVHDVLRIVWNRNAPLERRAADAQILEAGFEQPEDLVQPERGLQKFGIAS